jgi:hypothetical protein
MKTEKLDFLARLFWKAGVWKRRKNTIKAEAANPQGEVADPATADVVVEIAAETVVETDAVVVAIAIADNP